jgi:SAM-dependent methyltransferase
MDIEKAYSRISPFFNPWVKLMEIQTREMELDDSGLGGMRILIISPPTDPGIRLLSQANPEGETYLMCFSSRLEETAKGFVPTGGLRTFTAPFFRIPFGDEYFDAVFTNCFFDFCREDDFPMTVREIKRVLKKKGQLLSVYMDFPSTWTSRIWTGLFERVSILSQGSRPVDIRPTLEGQGFNVIKDISLLSRGFPLKYIQAEK